MKTLQELYKEVIASEELKREFMEAAKDEKEGKKKVEEFVKKHGCDATFADVKAFFEEKNNDELSEDEVEAVAGGKASDGQYAAMSLFGMGVGCAILGILDAVVD